MNPYYTPVRGEFIDTYAPLPTQELFGIIQAANAGRERRDMMMRDDMKEFSKFKSLSDKAVEEYYNSTLGVAKDFADKASKDPNYLNTPQGISEYNNIIRNIDYAKLSKLEQGSKELEQHYALAEKLKAEGKYNPDWHQEDYSNFDILGNHKLKDLTPYQSWLNIADSVGAGLVQDAELQQASSKNRYTKIVGKTEDMFRDVMSKNAEQLLSNQAVQRHLQNEMPENLEKYRDESGNIDYKAAAIDYATRATAPLQVKKSDFDARMASYDLEKYKIGTELAIKNASLNGAPTTPLAELNNNLMKNAIDKMSVYSQGNYRMMNDLKGMKSSVFDEKGKRLGFEDIDKLRGMFSSVENAAPGTKDYDKKLKIQSFLLDVENTMKGYSPGNPETMATPLQVRGVLVDILGAKEAEYTNPYGNKTNTFILPQRLISNLIATNQSGIPANKVLPKEDLSGDLVHRFPTQWWGTGIEFHDYAVQNEKKTALRDLAVKAANSTDDQYNFASAVLRMLPAGAVKFIPGSTIELQAPSSLSGKSSSIANSGGVQYVVNGEIEIGIDEIKDAMSSGRLSEFYGGFNQAISNSVETLLEGTGADYYETTGVDGRPAVRVRVKAQDNMDVNTYYPELRGFDADYANKVAGSRTAAEVYNSTSFVK